MTFSKFVVAGFVLLLCGCGPEKNYSTTAGEITIDCDEGVFPVISLLADDFQRQYPSAKIHLRSVEGRVAVSGFAMDSVRYIVLGREFDKEERDALSTISIDLQEYKVALSAVAVIGNKDNSLSNLRLTQLDSILSGDAATWSSGKRGAVDVAIGGPNSSANAIVRSARLAGKPLALTATPFPKSSELITYVKATPNALGIVSLSWIVGQEEDLRVFALGQPGTRPDTTEPVGRYYTPAQAHVHRKYYPLTTPVVIYRREVLPDLGYGFISYATSGAGQKLFLNNGLVPVTMPVRLVSLTSKGVN